MPRGAVSRFLLPSPAALPGAAFLALAALPGAAWCKAPSLQSLLGDPDDITVAGSVRVRYETLDGQPRAGFRLNDEQIALRTTLSAEYRSGGFRAGGEIYDSRAYLDKIGSTISANEVNTFELVQAYLGADIKSPFGKGTSAAVRVGRMMLNLGSRRLVAADDYRNTTNGYTGIRADLKMRGGTAATLIYTLPQIRLPDDLPSVRDHRTRWDRESFDLRLWGGLIARPATLAGATTELSYFRLQERDSPGRPTRDRNLHTVAARLIRDPRAGAWDFEVEGVYQFGGIRSGLAATASRLDVGAWFVHADIGYTFTGPMKLRLSAEYDHASGDGPKRGYGRFDTLFGMRRADLAPSGIYNALSRANIVTPGVRAEIAPTKRLDAFAVYRPMWLAARQDAFSSTGVRDASGRSGRFAGHQVEARLRYWLIPQFLRGEVNALWLAKGRFLHNAPNAPPSGDTRYISTGVTVTL
jgi:hypothetical protein